MAVDDLLGALWLPGDGKVNPSDLTMALARGARTRGARICERTRVTAISTAVARSGRRVTGVVVDTGTGTDQRTIEADVVVNCAGQWAKALGDQVG